MGSAADVVLCDVGEETTLVLTFNKMIFGSVNKSFKYSSNFSLYSTEQIKLHIHSLTSMFIHILLMVTKSDQ